MLYLLGALVVNDKVKGLEKRSGNLAGKDSNGTDEEMSKYYIKSS